MRNFLLCLLSFFLVNAVDAQDFTNKGKDFWIAYGNHVRMFNSNGNQPREKMQLYITSDVQTAGSVKIPGIGVTLPFSVLANEITTIDIPSGAALLDEGLYDFGIHVTADAPVVVYSFIYVNAVSGATLCLPSNTLGKDYYSINYNQVSNEANSYSYFNVVAADTGITTVQIIPAALTKSGRPAGIPFIINLKQGEVYQVLSSSDLTGSSIKSISNGNFCKRIAVFSGSGKVTLGCTNTNTADNLYQQMYPLSTWGKTYITTPSINAPSMSSQNNYYRVFKSEVAAQVKVNGNLIPANYFINNQYTDLPPGSAVNYIESDKPILVAQYLTTQGCAGNSGEGDPEMIYLNPVEQTVSSVTLNSMQPSLQTNIKEHYINVVLKNNPSVIKSFKIDGVSAGSFVTVPFNPEYAYAQIPVSKGTHTLEADSGFNAIAYGFGNAESYGYSAGTNLKDLYQFVSIRNQYATVNIPAGCRASPFKFSMTFPYQPLKIKWAFNGLFTDTTVLNPRYDSSFVVNGKTLYRYTLDKNYVINKIGSYPISLIVDNPTSDGCSGEQEINYELQIFERPSADFVVRNSGCLTDLVALTDITDGNGRQVIRWNWDLGDGISVVPNPVHKYKTSGTYMVKFSAITDVGCVSDTIQKPVILTEQPFARFTSVTPACEDQAVRFTDMSVPAGKIKSWKWDFGDGTTSTEGSPAHLFRDVNNYNVSLIIETMAGCVSEKESFNLPVYALPRANFITPEVCLNDPFAAFIDSSVIDDGTAGQLRYAWHFGDAGATPSNPNVSVDKNPIHKYMKAGVYDIALSVTSSNGCISDTVKKFTVNGAFPKADFQVKDETSLCSNKDVTVLDRSTVDFGQITKVEIYWNYLNDPSDKTVDEEPRPGKAYMHKFPDFGVPQSQQFQVLYVAYSGISCINQVSRTIHVAGVPKIEFLPLNAVCEEVSPFPLLHARDIYQYPGSGNYSGPGVSSAAMFNPTLAKDGLHTIRYTYNASNGCSAFGEQQIRVLPTPAVDAGPDRYLLEGESIIIDGRGEPGATYLWLPEAAIQDNNRLNPRVAPVDDMIFRLQVTGANGCRSSDDVTVKVLKKVKTPNAFSPNGDGVNDTWRIEHLESYPGATVEVFNRYGQPVYFSNGYSRPWDGNFQGKPLPNGTYYWIIQPKNGREQMKGSVTIIR